MFVDCAAAWKVIKTWLSAEAISKIKFATKSDIQTYVDKDLLFEHMGGTVGGIIIAERMKYQVAYLCFPAVNGPICLPL